MTWGVVLQYASGLGGLTVLVALVSLPWVLKKTRSETKKNEADAAKVLSESAMAFLAPARAEIGELEKRLRSANQRANSLEVALGKSQRKVHELESEVQGLRNQVGEMSKELDGLRHENESLRGGGR